MKNRKMLVTAIALSGSFVVGCSSSDQGSSSRTASKASSSSPGMSSGSSSQSASATGQQRSGGKISQSDMRKVEEALKAKGFDPGPINGQIDAQTQQALRDYQTKNKLAVTGMADPATAESLGIVIVFLPE